jgi:hypothetical protein
VGQDSDGFDCDFAALAEVIFDDDLDYDIALECHISV